MRKRNSNIEILRIISMFMIILGHCNIYSNLNLSEVGNFLNKFIIGNTYLGNLGVIIFILTTGYFMVKKEISLKKIILFELQVLFYSICIYLLLSLLGIINFNLKEFIKCCFPVITKQYWFFSTYIIFYFFVPFVNKFILSLEKKELKTFLIVFSIFFSVIPTLFSLDFLKNDFLQFLLFYSIGAYININFDEINDIKKVRIILLLCVIFMLCYSSFIIILSYYDANFIGRIFYFSYRSSFIMILIAICITILFLKRKEFCSKPINYISSSVFGIYLIHDNQYLRDYLWNNVFALNKYASSRLLVLYMLITVFIIFVCSSIIELIRKNLLEKNYLKLINRIWSDEND